MDETILSSFEILANNVIEKAETFSITLNKLPEVTLNSDIRKYPGFEEIFTALDKKVNHCLYWFELETSNSTSILNNLLNESRVSLLERKRVVPVINSNQNSTVLYVGIRRGGQRKYDGLSNISGRLIQHLGYYHVGATQGLQLVHWANKAETNINFKVVEFNNLPSAYLEMLEKLIAYKLKPLCGRH